MSDALFRKVIWRHFRAYRRDFPWRRTKDPYHILVSEVMLQQTQTQRVIQKYGEFLTRFPNFKTLAHARLSQVFRVWQGMGYNRRALALKRLAVIVVRDYKGRLPQDLEQLVALPGVGNATAGAICAFAFNKPVPFIETNIRRVYIHFFFPQKRKVQDADILKLVARTIDMRYPREWFWALMDYGAMLAVRSSQNPNRRSLHYRKQTPFMGSRRQLRGKILKLFIIEQKLSAKTLAHRFQKPIGELKPILKALATEGFIRQKAEDFTLV